MNTAAAKLPPLRDTSRVAIPGVSGSGKSTAAKEFVRAEMKRGTRIAFFDPEDEYSVHAPSRGNVDKGPLTQRATWDEFVSRGYRYWLDRPDLALAVVPDDDDDDAAEQCREFVEAVKGTGNLCAGFDELGGYAFGNDNASIAQKALNTLATKGRKWPVSAIFVSQRMVHIPLSARASVTAMLSFNQVNPADLRALAELTGSEEFSAGVASHGVGEASLWLSPLLRGKETTS